jgi:cyclopropane fatty-acyl-phospholipid synthase-like methyltransferase
MDLEQYLAKVRENRFIPIPRPEEIFVGGTDQDFLRIGVDTLRSLVKHCQLQAGNKVLDIGSGIGRIALPLTQWLDQTGEYLGLDVVQHGVRWCEQNITARYPNFRFLHLDLQNDYYNPSGTMRTEDVCVPAPHGHFDLAVFCSVFTHLPEDQAAAYFRLVDRHLAHGGQIWATWFLMDQEARAAVERGETTLRFSFEADSVTHHLEDGFNRLHAVAYDWPFVAQLYHRHGYEIALLQRGNWCSRRVTVGGGYQDLIVARQIRKGG